ncbi:G1/S-specific cyclin-D3-like [Centruroides sculpturatus]|uniref:G1/S-specific cyclin-D3-like n=1 Tax=Centruroides sculpturatus TaxID=218467 RepID=UPI000C6D5B9E|nr:G1/S-specific cyclin-D3-like [Centruroides sculpturatus]
MESAELLCNEKILPSWNDSSPTRAAPDPALQRDGRVLERLLSLETKHVTGRRRLLSSQVEIDAGMRKIVARWMSEVCDERCCEDVVFPLAMNYLDRFLSIVTIRKSQLQLVGAVCLLIASKLRQSLPFTSELLVYYTDYSVGVDEIRAWELLILTTLKWDVAPVVATDFVDHLLIRLPVDKNRATVRRHANTFIALCSIDDQFASYPPSLIATASVAAAADGLEGMDKPWNDLDELLSLLQQITGIEAASVGCVVHRIERAVRSEMAAALESDPTPPDGGGKTRGKEVEERSETPVETHLRGASF